MAVKNDLKKLRKEQRLKQADLAIAVGMCENSISNISLRRIQPAMKQLSLFPEENTDPRPPESIGWNLWHR